MNKSKKVIGIGSALFSGITWGIDTILIGVVLSKSIFTANNKIIFLAPFISTFFHDFFSSLWMLIYNINKGNLKRVFMKTKTRSGKFIMLAAIMGGPIGMVCYSLSVKNMGASYTAIITSLYPAAGALFSYIFLKEKLNLRTIIGISISILGVIITGFNASAVGNDIVNIKLGFIFSIGTVLGWSLESVICAYGMKEDVLPEEALNIRQLTSSILILFVVIPCFGGIKEVVNVGFNNVILIIALTSLVGTMSYMFYYKAITCIGAARSTALNITYSFWAIVVQWIFFGVHLDIKLLIGSVVLICGTILVISNPLELINLKRK
ncbi:DMT family transporter [Hathewaya histolytica]|uniref:DMT family transporter n=1 Tax=Hathewaya histolytica TaxID=1498 RepID=UPI003B67F333